MATYAWRTSLDIVQQQNREFPGLHGIKRSHSGSESSRPQIQSSHTHNGYESATRGSFLLGGASENAPSNHVEASKIIDLDTAEAWRPNATQASRVSTPGPTQNPLLLLSHPRYGLPDPLVSNFSNLGINSMYPWQSSCLLGRGLLGGEKNLVYTAPTGGGKSLVADVLMLKRIIENPSKKAILVLPYVALVQEKLKWLRKVLEGVPKNDLATFPSDASNRKMQRPHTDSVRVVGYFGGSKARLGWSDVDIAVCTMEKANGLVNTAIEDGSVINLGVIVLDELHMIDDDQRGYLMELMASKVLSLETSVQIVGMSATLTNTELLAEWLKARYYSTKYVPVPIDEYLVYDNQIFPVSTSSAFFKTASQIGSGDQVSSLQATRKVLPSSFKELQQALANAVVALAVETAVSDHGALVFCGGRQSCQSVAALIAGAMPVNHIRPELFDRRRDVVSELQSLPVGLDETLGRTLIRGVAFHHAGLTIEEREIIAEAYDQGIIRVIVATCSLAAGINLPARRVILQGARMGRELIGPAMLRQMRGRAGRKGKDEIGESYLCCRKADLEEVAQLLEADSPPLQSSLTTEKRGIQRALLEVVTVRLATQANAIREYISRTLLYHMISQRDALRMVDQTLAQLVESGLVKTDQDGSFEATALSKAIVASYLTPEDGLFLHSELRTALQAFVMDGEMHIFYTFAPVCNTGNVDINWCIFRKEIENLDESGLRVLRFVGVSPVQVNRLANSGKTMPAGTAEEIRQERIYRRFYTALQLRDLCNEVPVHLVARKYDVPRGAVQSLAQMCEGFAAGMIQFCDKMGWGMLKAALEHMSDRLKAGARADLLELAQLPFVKSRTARIFWENGFKHIRKVAEAESKDLLPVMVLARPRKSRLEGEEETKFHQKLLLKADVIIAVANKLWERQQQVEIEMDA